MQTTTIGNRAEQVAVEYLNRLGHTIINRNWRRRECEIDIVTNLSGAVYFVEVKYRVSDTAGSGMEYITHSKLKRMRYAAERWVAEHDWRGEYMLAAIEVSGEAFEVTDFVECII